MKKFSRILMAAAVLFGGLLSWSCNPAETDEKPSEEDSRTYPSRPITVTVGSLAEGDTFPETRSQVEIDDDKVYLVTIYLFDSSTGKILLREDGSEGGSPWVTTAESNTFAFDLPYADIDVDVYTICNYAGTTLPTATSSLKESDLDGLTYSITSINQLQSMPMAGRETKHITTTTSSLKVSVDRLFAVYYVNFDLSAVRAKGYSIDALHLTTHSVNRTVHWFRPEGGDAATAVNDQLDYANSQELRLMADGANAYVYVLENMQGTIPGASSWRTVQKDLGGAVALCTYIDVAVKIHDNKNNVWQNWPFQVYLGNGDMTSEFDIPRNYRKNITIKIPGDGIVSDPDYPTFVWGSAALTLDSGESKRVPFSTTAIPSSYSLVFSSDESGVSVSDVKYTYAASTGIGSGSVLISAASDIGSSVSTFVKGGDGENCQDVLPVEVEVAEQPVYEFCWIDDDVTIAAGQTRNMRFYMADLLLEDINFESSDPHITLGTPDYYPGDSDYGTIPVSVSSEATGTWDGTVTGSFTKGGGGSDDLTVHVQGGSEITYEYDYVIDPEESSIEVNGTQEYTITCNVYTYIDGVLQPGYESNVMDNSAFNWSSARTSVATVSGGVATGRGVGKTDITATMKGDSSIKCTAELNVTPAAVVVERWEITPEETTLAYGQSVTYTITRYDDVYAGGTLVEADTQGTVVSNGQFSWSSSSDAVASVSPQGVATVNSSAGSASVTIYASKSGISTLSAVINVSNDFSESYGFEVTPETITIGRDNQTAKFTATYTTYRYVLVDGEPYGDPVSTSSNDVSEMAQWSFVGKSSSEYATNSGGGYFGWIKGGGSETVRATFNGMSDDATLNTADDVVTQYSYTLLLDPDELSIAENKTESFTAYFIHYQQDFVNGVPQTDAPYEVGRTDVTSSVQSWTLTGNDSGNGGVYVVNNGDGSFTWAAEKGTVGVTATYMSGGESYTDDATIKTGDHTAVVTPSEYVYALEVSPESATITYQGSASFTATYITYEYETIDYARTGVCNITRDNVTSSATWSIVSGSQYVTNDGEGSFSWLKGGGSATIKAAYSDCSDTATISTGPGPVPVPEYELVISPDSQELPYGESVSFTATYYTRTYLEIDGVRLSDTPESVTETDVTGSAVWSIDSGSVYVTKDGGGSYSWKSGPGTAVISAWYSSKTDTAEITVLGGPVDEYEYSVVIDPDSQEMGYQESVTFTATYIKKTYQTLNGVRLNGGEPISVEETPITSASAWSIESGSDYVTKDGQSAGKFNWKAGPGTATVKAGYGNGDAYAYDTAEIDVTQGISPEPMLYIDPASASIDYGETAEFKAYYVTAYWLVDSNGNHVGSQPDHFGSGDPQDVTTSATWSVVSGSQYVTMTGKGSFEWAGGPGSAKVSAAYNSLSDEAVITTSKHEPVITYTYEYSMVPEESSVTVGQTQGYTITETKTKFVDGVEQPNPETRTANNNEFSWTSGSTAIATVSNGNATGVDSGKTTITATRTDPNNEPVSLSATLHVSHIFVFTGASSDEILPGGTVDLYYETTLPENLVSASYSKSGFSTVDKENGIITVSCASTVSPGTSVNVTGGNQGKEATDYWTIDVGTPPSSMSIEIVELSDNGTELFPGQYQYHLKCIVTASDGTVYESTDPAWEQSFVWWSPDEAPASASSGVATDGEGWFQVRIGNNETMRMCCTFEQTLDAEFDVSGTDRIPEIKSMKLEHVGDPYPMPFDYATFWQSQHQYRATVTFVNGLEITSDDSRYSRMFQWDAIIDDENPDGIIYSRGDGYYEVGGWLDTGDARYYITCSFGDEECLRTLDVRLGNIEVTYRDERVEGQEFDTLHVYVIYKALRFDNNTYETVEIEIPYHTGLELGCGDSYIVSYDMVEGGTWTGCDDVIPHGATARYYINGVLQGGI